MLAAICAPRAKEMAPAASNGESIVKTWKSALSKKKYWVSLIGTAGTWFLFDVVMYGVSLSLPDLVTHIFDRDGHTQSTTEKLVRLICIKFPGPAIAGFTILFWIHKNGNVKHIMGAGFAALMATFTLLLIFMLTLSDSPAALLTALILTQSS